MRRFAIRRFAAGAAIGTALCLAAAAPSTGQEQQREQREQAQPDASAEPPDVTVLVIEEAAKQPPADVSPGAIAADPQRYYGKNVRVKAEVEDVLGERVFSLDEDRAFAGPDLLVLGPAGPNPRDGSNVTVTGVVRPYVRAHLERDYDWLRLTTEQELVFKSRPVLVASEVRADDATRPAPSAEDDR
ncbi:MAG: hypothetical protein DCC71_00970 [Proteobacteria bacterium]|nr:MAG: hypothetical protein DCC71_00970 [Pseudomonadota bacterium]